MVAEISKTNCTGMHLEHICIDMQKFLGAVIVERTCVCSHHSMAFVNTACIDSNLRKFFKRNNMECYIGLHIAPF